MFLQSFLMKCWKEMVYLSFTSFPKYGVTNFLTNGHFSTIYVNSVDVYFYFLKPSHKFKTFARHFEEWRKMDMLSCDP